MPTNLETVQSKLGPSGSAILQRKARVVLPRVLPCGCKHYSMSKFQRSSLARLFNFLRFPLALFVGLGDVELSDYEKRVLNKELSDYIWQSGFSQSFLAWRRRLLYFASLLFTVSASLLIVDLVRNGIYNNDDEAVYTAVGLASLVSQRIPPFVALSVTFVAAWLWTDYTKSRKVLVPGWVLGLLLMLWPSLVPVDNMLVEPTDADRVLQGVLNAITILPTYLALIGGLTLGTKRVFSFAPSPLTGRQLSMTCSTPFWMRSRICHSSTEA